MLSDNILQFSYSSNTLVNDRFTSTRRNPFDNDVTDSISPSPSSEVSQISSENSIFVTDHFDQPLAYCDKRSSIDDLTVAVKECKLKILNIVDNQESKDKFIERLIELQQALHTAKETMKERRQPDLVPLEESRYDSLFVYIAGHKFIRFRKIFGPRCYCEACHGAVLTARSAYRCQECEIFLHNSTNCLQGLHRACPASDHGHPSMFPSQIMTRRRFSSADCSLHIDIDSYPITGSLATQRFLCHECNYPLRATSATDSISTERSPPKYCHYYQRFYCQSCHWDNKFIIPSVYFMLNKWKEMSVCRSAFIKLQYMWNRAQFRMPVFWQQNNASVGNVLLIRKKLFYHRHFIYKCPDLKKMTETSPLWLIEQPYLVTMQFVESISTGSALESVQVLYSAIVAHVAQCQVCQRSCSPCHLCHDPETLNVMSRSVWSCSQCSVTCIHEKCAISQYKEKSEYLCPHCSKE